ncbi:MAG TPA: DUF2079 domain-containing protein [Lentimicrobium sp.]|nr:DUF2079 domain-containing protein [Lentimicrobium sp.]
MKNKLFRISFSIVFLIFAVVYFITSLYPHINFRSAALDLGMFNHALYSYAHFKPNTFTLALSGNEVPYLGDHFSLITMLYAPFYYLFGEYTLLIIQILSILAGGYGVYKYSIFKGLNQWISLLMTIHFFTLFGIFSALNFDFHNNVIAAMLVPWFIYFFDKGNIKWMLVFYFLILFSKENMALWMSFILLALLIRKEGSTTAIQGKWTALLAAFAFIYFLIVVQFIMPAISKGMGVDQMDRYSHIGNSLGEIALKIWQRPDKYFIMLFENTLGLTEGTGVKGYLHFLVLVSGGFAFFRRPYFLIMLIPVYAQKMLSNSTDFWGIENQYSIEFVPVISLAVISLIQRYKGTMWSWIIASLVIYSSVHFNERNLRFLKKKHYNTDIRVKEVNELIKKIPDDAIISVNSSLAPHLAFRDKIYLYPVIKDAEYVALIKKRGSYPLKPEVFEERMLTLKNQPGVTVIAETEDILIVRLSNNTKP